MKILVIGGTYFLGKAFVNRAYEKGHDLTLFNRGTVKTENFNCIKGDRHNADDLKQLAGMDFDAVADFCAYEKGDIESVVKSGVKTKQYIFVSTTDVYKRNTDTLKNALDENAPLEDRTFDGEEGAYILGKITLEKELDEVSKIHDIYAVSVRPSMIYGPDNYAPREGIFFNWIDKAGQILIPSDADGFFQPVHVFDVADVMIKAIENKESVGRAINVCTTRATYESFAEALKIASDKPFDIVEISTDEVVKRQIPLPFPLFKEESYLYDGSRAEALLGGYIKLSDGLKNCYKT